MNADGSSPVRVTFGNGIDGTGSWTKPGFSADGRRIFCTRSVGTSVDIFVISLNAPGDPPRQQVRGSGWNMRRYWLGSSPVRRRNSRRKNDASS